MPGMLSEEVEHLLNAAFLRAKDKRHEYLTVEHILLALTDANSLTTVWRTFGIPPSALVTTMTEIIDSVTPLCDDDREVQPTIGFQRVLQRAVFYAQTARHGNNIVQASDVLLAIFSERQSNALKALQELGVERVKLAEYLRGGQRSVKLEQATDSSPSRNFDREVALISSVDVNRRTSAPPRKIFVSYSHADMQALERLQVHLRPLHRSGKISCWSDKNIRAGEKWKEEIRKAIDEADIAILLLSADFLASEFIVENELPPLLAKAEAEGKRILPVLLKPCGFLRDPILSAFQAINDAASPLLGMPHIEQEALYDRIAAEVAKEIQCPTLRD